MRKFVIVTLGFAGIAGAAMTETSLASKVQYSEKELQAYCDKKGGNFSSGNGGGYGCSIGSGQSGVTINCTQSGNCVMNNTVVFTAPTKFGRAAAQAASTTGFAGSASSSGSASTAGKSPAAGNASTNGTLAASGPSTNKSTTQTTPVTVSTTSGSGGGMPQNGRPGLRQQ